MTKTEAIEKALNKARKEIGYLEKRSNASLDSKEANAGSNNYTKYWRDVYPAYQAQAWCACFVSWILLQAFGKDKATKLLKHWPYVYCPTLASMTSNTTPHKGDIIIFYRGGTFTHTGVVESVNGAIVTTIEGNTSGASGIIANGGGVCRKAYNTASLPGTRYFTPDWSLVSEEKPERKINKDGTYTVKAGDTLSEIAQDFKGMGCTVKYLKKWNKLKSDMIHPGQQLKLCYWKGKVAADNAPVRAGAGKKKELIDTLKKGAVLEVTGSRMSAAGNKWYKVRHKGKIRYVCAKWIKKA